MKQTRRYMSILLCAVLTAAMLAACGAEKTDGTESIQESGAGAAAVEQTTGEAEKKESQPSQAGSDAGQKGSSAAQAGSTEQQTAASSSQAESSAAKPTETASSAESGPADKTPETASTKPTEASSAAQQESAEEVQGAGESGEGGSGASMEDAIPMPLDTKIYGTASYKAGTWYAFTTGEQENATYMFATVVKNPWTGDTNISLDMEIYDVGGKKLTSKNAYTDGQAASRTFSGVKPETTYYIQLKVYLYWEFAQEKGDYPLDYMFYVREVNAKTDAAQEQGGAIALSANLAEAKGTLDAQEGNIRPSTNMDDAQLVPLGMEVHGKISADQKYDWYAFTTEETGYGVADYKVTLSKDSPGTKSVSLFVYAEDGNNRPCWMTRRYGEGTGTDNCNVSKMTPDTIYYVAVECPEGEAADYTFSVSKVYKQSYLDSLNKDKGKDSGDSAGSGDKDGDNGPMVFETPFELNETQVRFVSNKATFFNAADAKAAVAPVAEVLLAHPGHPILIAGTTATVGKQDSTEKLSEKRAQAVKDLLVREFGVPESQIITIGLGYAKDPFVRGKDIDSKGRFVETEAAKNRRVVIIDINDPIAQKLLK